MSLEKAILYKKEHRAKYWDARDFLRSCRNHQGCSYCLSNRLHSDLKQKEKAISKMDEFLKGEEDDE